VAESEREILEREVETHRERITELQKSLRDIEQNLGDVVGAPAELIREACALKMALKGRTGAVMLGAARLEMLCRVEAYEEL
jgi:DNA anti-recombination protein RmuC